LDEGDEAPRRVRVGRRLPAQGDALPVRDHRPDPEHHADLRPQLLLGDPAALRRRHRPGRPPQLARGPAARVLRGARPRVGGGAGRPAM
ncbi:MAG: hypothetical protein AVDCRST_MAG30-823, partial [uncultured Solirubrobacteraceae bacterium]